MMRFPVLQIGPGLASGGLGALRWGSPLPEQGSRGQWAGEGTRVVQGAGRRAVLVAAGEDVELVQPHLLREQIAASSFPCEADLGVRV